MSETLLVIISILLLLMLLLIVFLLSHFYKKTDASFYFKTTSILRKNALLTEKIGPEFRQYWFDHDTDGKPFHVTTFKVLCF